MRAELAYVFRHALLRDAAYSLQLPGDRAKLHELAFYLIEDAFGGRAPEPPPLDPSHAQDANVHATDSVALELADHALLAGAGMDGPPRLLALRCRYLQRGADHAARHFQAEACATAWQQLSGHLAGVPRAEALRRAAMVLFQAGYAQRGQALLLAALQTDFGDRSYEGVLLLDQGNICLQTGRVSEAEALYEKALAIHREFGATRGEGIALGNLGIVCMNTGRMQRAEELTLQALVLHRKAGNRNSEGTSLSILASICQDTGRLAQAEEANLQALAIHREIGNRRSEGVVLGNLAGVYSQKGEAALAEHSSMEALEIHREVGNRRGEGISLGNMAVVFLNAGKLAEAERTTVAALAIHREVGNRRSEGVALGELAYMQWYTGRLAAAERGFTQALAIHGEISNRRYVATHGCAYALCLLDLGRQPEARERWLAGFAALREMGDVAEAERRAAEMRRTCAKVGVPAFDEPAAGA